MGTLEIICSTPGRFETIMFGKVIGNIVWGLGSMVITFLFAIIIFRVNVAIKNPLVFLGILILSLASFAGISMLLATCFTLSRNSRALMNCLEYPVFILCGVMFPIEILPLWTRPLSYILSPTWAVNLLRECVLGIENAGLFIRHTGILVLITVVYFTAALLLFRKMDKETRLKASLGVY